MMQPMESRYAAPRVTVHAFGQDALLIELPAADLHRITSLDHHLRSQGIPGVLEIIPAEDSLLIRLDRADAGSERDRLVQFLTAQSVEHLRHTTDGDASTSASTPAEPKVDRVLIPVLYDGLDLHLTAQTLGLSIADLIAMHSGADFTVAFCGFSPGFAYLTGLPELLHLPRRTTPRIQVPAGSVAIAEHYSAVYPRSSPGGWHLLGRTDRVLFEPSGRSPALLQPGIHVQFTPITDRIEVATPSTVSDASTQARPDSPAVEVVHPGVSCLVEDLGRHGWGRVAVTESGAWDRRSHRLAQRLVGNPEDAAGLECLGGGLRLRALSPLTVAVTGAPGPITITDGHGSQAGSVCTPVHLRAGEELHLGHPTEGLRRYVAVRGGLDIPPVMGSAATDTLSRLGPDPLTPGTRLAIRKVSGPIPASDLSLPDPIHREVGVIPGPAWPLLTAESRQRLTELSVSPASDRIGVRLEGPILEWEASIDPPDARIPRAITRASRPLVRGAIQLPPDGRPVVMGPDHPATGGYPVIGVLADPDAPAQWAPGVTVHLREVVPFLLARRAASSTGRAADS